MTTTDAVTTAAALASVVVAGLGVYVYTQLGAVDDQTQAERTDDAGEAVRKARRRPKGKTPEHDGAGDVGLPGGFDATPTIQPSDTGDGQTTTTKKQQKKKKKGGQAGVHARDTDGSWTHADLGRGSPVVEPTPAEERVSPRRAGLDSASGGPARATGARVARVQPADAGVVPGASGGDARARAEGEDAGGWGVVRGRSRRPTETPAAAAPPRAAAPQESMTKKQRQNARRRALAKAVKTEAEAARLQGLAKHKRELERLKIIEQSRQGGGKQTSGGMHATVDDRGKLVWE